LFVYLKLSEERRGEGRYLNREKRGRVWNVLQKSFRNREVCVQAGFWNLLNVSSSFLRPLSSQFNAVPKISIFKFFNCSKKIFGKKKNEAIT
jgi:hypothetical protein